MPQIPNREKTITISILPDISKSKGDLIMKFCQVIEHNVRNIFVKKSGRK